MKRAKIKTPFDSMSDADFETKSGSIYDFMMKSTYFPAPTPELPVILADIQAFSASLIAAKTKDKTAVAAKVDARNKLTLSLIQLANSVTTTANGDRTKLITSGFDLAKQGESNPLKKPEIITLADGTNVVLQANSKLDYPEKFLGNAREVILSGEAYFDVAHDAKKPFIIHTGRIRTTVLGTAFNIRALPDGKEIIVSVTRGKVKVEDDKKLLAVLTPNEQAVYVPVTAAVLKDTVNANTLVTDWTKHEMRFEGQTFEEVTALLGRRYGVNILFKKNGLKKCSIKAYFSGTETLEKVLDVLSIISNATYSMPDDKTVLLEGEGCGE